MSLSCVCSDQGTCSTCKERDRLREDWETIRQSKSLRVRFMNTFREIVGRRMPKNKSGTPVLSDFDLLDANIAERLEAIQTTLQLQKKGTMSEKSKSQQNHENREAILKAVFTPLKRDELTSLRNQLAEACGQFEAENSVTKMLIDQLSQCREERDQLKQHLADANALLERWSTEESAFLKGREDAYEQEKKAFEAKLIANSEALKGMRSLIKEAIHSGGMTATVCNLLQQALSELDKLCAK